MAYCGEQTAVKYAEKRRLAVSLKCRSWTCDDCKDLRRRQLLAQAIGGSPTTFLTLTLRVSEAKDREDAARKLARAWRLCRLRIMRHMRWRKLPFIAVFEQHVSGRPHLHILLRSGFIPVKLISHFMQEIANSPIVYITRARGAKQIAFYCAKYVTKEATKFGTSKRYWKSADYDLRTDRSVSDHIVLGGGWEIEKLSLVRWEHQMLALGWTVKRHSHEKYEAYAPP